MIHQGTKEAQVDFLFENQEQTYRVMRTRTRGQASSLEFQIATANGFRSLTEPGVRATQQLILQHLKLDYETFVNSAYLRQGRADEFMLKRPSERKQILTDLLKLDHYDHLAEQAKERSREFKAKVELLEQVLTTTQTQLQQQPTIAAAQAELEAAIAQMRQAQTAAAAQLQALQVVQQQRQTWEQQQQWHQQQQRNLTQDYQQLQQELVTLQRQQQELTAILQQEAAIAQGYAHWQHLHIQEEVLSKQYQAYQQSQDQRQALLRQQAQQVETLKDQHRQLQAQLEACTQQVQEQQQILSKLPEVEAALEQLHQARTRLSELDQLQTQVTPLHQRRTTLQTQIDRLQARQVARWEELQSQAGTLQHQQLRQPQLEQQLQEATQRIEQLDKRRVYQQRVREKGLERKSFMERLQTHQQDYETQLADLEQKLQLHLSPGAACPLCDRPPWMKRTGNGCSRSTVPSNRNCGGKLWVVREQLAVSEREIQVLRQEYQDLNQELVLYNTIWEQRGQLQAQIQGILDSQTQLAAIAAEISALEASLQQGDFAAELQAELQQLSQHLELLPYDEKDHALARGEVERWRWAEIKQAEIKQAQRRLTQSLTQPPLLQTQISNCQQQLDYLLGTGAFAEAPGEIQQQIIHLDQQLAAIGYDPEQHHALRTQVRQVQSWQIRYQELQQAQQQAPPRTTATRLFSSSPAGTRAGFADH